MTDDYFAHTSLDSFPVRVSHTKPNKIIQHAGAIVASLYAFAVGNALGWSSPATPLLLKEGKGFPVSEYETSLIGSLLTIGAAVSCIPAGYITDKIGRKITLLGSVPLFVIGWALITWGNSIIMLFAGRLILGICSGAVCVTAPVFTAEICQTEMRGALGSYYQLLLASGILFIYVIGSQLSVFGFSLVSGIVPIISGLLFLFFPETPVYFLVKGQPEKARKSLLFFRGPKYDLESELCELAEFTDKKGAKEESFWTVFASKQGIKSVAMAIGMMIFQQLSGVNAIVFYTTTIFEEAGSSLEPKYSTIIIGSVMVFSTLLMITVADRIGRVILLGVSAVFMSTSTLALGVYFHLKENNFPVESLSWLPLVSLSVFVIMFSIGYGPVPWALIPEIIPPKIKATASSIACVVNWLFAFLVTKFFSDLTLVFGTDVAFWIFAGISAIGTAFSFKILPETKGKTLEEIQRELGGEERK